MTTARAWAATCRDLGAVTARGAMCRDLGVTTGWVWPATCRSRPLGMVTVPETCRALGAVTAPRTRCHVQGPGGGGCPGCRDLGVTTPWARGAAYGDPRVAPSGIEGATGTPSPACRPPAPPSTPGGTGISRSLSLRPGTLPRHCRTAPPRRPPGGGPTSPPPPAPFPGRDRSKPARRRRSADSAAASRGRGRRCSGCRRRRGGGGCAAGAEPRRQRAPACPGHLAGRKKRRREEEDEEAAFSLGPAMPGPTGERGPVAAAPRGL